MAEPLVVGISATSVNGIPKQIEIIKAALNSTGLELDIRVLPGERSIVLLTQGEIAIDVYRQPAALAIYQNLIRLDPSVGQLEFWLVTHASTPHLCKLDESEHVNYRVVGVRGARFFKNFVYHNFFDFEEVNTFTQTLQMIGDKRVEFTVFPIRKLKSISRKFRGNMHVCDEHPYLTLKFYSYIHKKYAWAIPVIEESYRKYFPQ